MNQAVIHFSWTMHHIEESNLPVSNKVTFKTTEVWSFAVICERFIIDSVVSISELSLFVKTVVISHDSWMLSRTDLKL